MGSALPGMMQITLAMRSVAVHGRRLLYQCLPAMRCTRENNDKRSKRSVAGQLCTSRNGMVGLNEGGGIGNLFQSLAGTRCAAMGDGRSSLDRMISLPACGPT